MLGQIAHVTALFRLGEHFRVVDLIRGLNCLVVSSKDLAFSAHSWHLCNVFGVRFTAHCLSRGTCCKEHRVWVLGVRCYVSNIRSSNVGIKIIDSVLQISRIVSITFWGFMLPQQTRPLWTEFVIFKSSLALKQAAKARIAKRSMQGFTSVTQTGVFVVERLFDFVNLL